MPVFRTICAAALGLAATTFVGCGAEKTPLGQVEGTVTYKAQPLPEGTITFIPQTGRGANGVIVDGKIQNVTCFEPNDGVPLGPCKVAITAFTKQAEGSTAPSKSLIPEKYGNIEKSDLKAEIKSGKNELKFDLQ